MKLRSIKLSNVRRFAGQTATISGIGDGISVIAAPNEFGKSTFFDALHALFFQPYGTAHREVKSLQPDPAGGPVGISAEVELPTGGFRIEKSFLAKRSARITDLTQGRIIAQDDAAEDWMRALVDHGLNGPAGLLWVRQGVTSFDTGTKDENAKSLTERRHLMSSVAGEIDLMTGGRRMDRVRDRCMAELERYTTAQGRPKTGGPWRAAKDDIATLEATIADLKAKCDALSDALAERQRIRLRLAELARPEAERARQTSLLTAKAAYDIADAHAARVADARQKAEIARLNQEQGADRLATLDRAIRRTTETRIAAEKVRADLTDLEGRHAVAVAVLGAARADADGVADRLKALRTALGAVQRRAAAQAAQTRLTELTKRLDEADKYRADAEAADARIAASRATPDNIAAVDRAVRAVDAARLAAEAQAVTLTLTYDGTTKISADGQPMPAGRVILSGPTVLNLPGIGQMVVDPGAHKDDGKTLATAMQALSTALATCGAATIEAAHQTARDRKTAEDESANARKLIKVIAPDGLSALRTAIAQTAGEAADLETDAVGDPLKLTQDITTAEAEEQDAARKVRAAENTASSLNAEAAALRMRLSAAMSEANDAETAAGPADTRATRLAQANTAAAQAGADLLAATTALTDLQSAAPDILTARAELKRAQSVVDEAAKETEKLSREQARLNGVIETQAEEAIEERLAEAKGALDAATERERRYAGEVAALTRLRDVLEEVRHDARETYFKPVQQELQPLLAILASDAALTFDHDRLLPGQITRRGMEEPVDRLSGGTQEQIAILTRLAFARLFAKGGSPVPVILDDALVHTDDDRIVRMFRALHRVAADQQVIVFTCRQMAFQALGGDRPEIRITDS